MTVTEPAAPASTRWTAQWKELYEEVVTTGLCTGCAGCVIACPHDVIGYDHVEKGYRPYHLEEELGPADCIHGVRGCTSCTRACPRFRAWETEANVHLFGRDREPDEMYGIAKDLLLCRATDQMVFKMGQDGGFVSAMLIWAMAEGYIDCVLTSFLEGDGTSWKAVPGLARNNDEILASAAAGTRTRRTRWRSTRRWPRATPSSPSSG
jgi:coenzyme F420 hydrogenase subunit beta